jgi:CheY-like chemotaxis protein
LSILWVDDQPDTVLGAAKWLQTEGHEVSFAHTPEAAVDQFAGAAFHLALIDICLFDEDGRPTSGFDLAQQLQAKQDVPLAFVTAHRTQLERPDFVNHLGIVYKAGDLVAALSRLLRDLPRPDQRVARLVSIAQRLKRERDQARRERDVDNTVLEIWLSALWSRNRG